MPDFPRPVAVVDPAVIWTYVTRELTAITGTPRANLVGADEPVYTRLDTPVSTRARAIEEEGVDTLTADGTEQTVRQILNVEQKLHAYIDLANMASGDEVVIRQYIQIGSGKPFRLFATETYTDAQALPMLHITMKPARYGIRITLQQTLGTYKSFDWQTLWETA